MFIYILIFNGPVAHWLERTPDKREVGGSSPLGPPLNKIVMGLSSAGRAPALHAGGQRFDPASLHHIICTLKTR